MKANKIKFNKNIIKNKKAKIVSICAIMLCILSSCIDEDKINKPDDNLQVEDDAEFNNDNESQNIVINTIPEETKDEIIEEVPEEDIIEEVIPETIPDIEIDPIINIKDITLSDDSVSTYNTDYKMDNDLKKEIDGYIKSFGGDCSFLTVNLNDGMSFGYNIDATYSTASTIKAAFCLYCCKEIDKGNGTLDEMKIYEERFRRDGSGLLQYQPSGTEYSLKDLMFYTIDCSDNVAYYMLHDRFYNEGYNELLKELGCNNLYLYDGARWGQIDARSMALVWQEIYKYKDESENGKYLFELLTNAQYNYISEGMENYSSAHKSGWTQKVTHDCAIVFANDEYIVIILNQNNGNYSAKSQLLKLSGCIEKGITNYELYKKENTNIKILKK